MQFAYVFTKLLQYHPHFATCEVLVAVYLKPIILCEARTECISEEVHIVVTGVYLLVSVVFPISDEQCIAVFGLSCCGWGSQGKEISHDNSCAQAVGLIIYIRCGGTVPV